MRLKANQLNNLHMLLSQYSRCINLIGDNCQPNRQECNQTCRKACSTTHRCGNKGKEGEVERRERRRRREGKQKEGRTRRRSRCVTSNCDCICFVCVLLIQLQSEAQVVVLGVSVHLLEFTVLLMRQTRSKHAAAARWGKTEWHKLKKKNEFDSLLPLLPFSHFVSLLALLHSPPLLLPLQLASSSSSCSPPSSWMISPVATSAYQNHHHDSRQTEQPCLSHITLLLLLNSPYTPPYLVYSLMAACCLCQ